MKGLDLFEVLEPADFDSVKDVSVNIKKKLSKPSKLVKKKIRQIPRRDGHFILRPKSTVIAVVCAALLISLSLVACTNNNIRNWILSLFDVTPQITEKTFVNTHAEGPKYDLKIYPGFLTINLNSSTPKIFVYEDVHFTQEEMKHCSGSFEGYSFSFDYFINDRAMATSNIETDLRSFSVDYLPGSTTKAIASVSREIAETDTFYDIWLLDLITGKIEPLIDRTDADWFEHAEIPDNDRGIFTSRRYAVNVQPSYDGRFILFESNRDFYPVLNNAGQMGSSHSYIFDMETGDEWRVDPEAVPWADKGIWINDQMILFNSDGPSMQIYDAVKKKVVKEISIQTQITSTNGTVYSILDIGDSYIFTDLLTEEQFRIEKKVSWESDIITTSNGDRYYTEIFEKGICLYDLKTHIRIDFPYAYLDCPYTISFIDKNTVLLVTYKEGDYQPRFYMLYINNNTHRCTEVKILPD